MKDLTPAMKESTRYMKFRIHSDEHVSLSEFVNKFWDEGINFLGTKNISEASPWVIANKFDEEKQEGIIRVNREFEHDVRAFLTLISKIGDQKGFIEIKKTSGSLGGVS